MLNTTVSWQQVSLRLLELSFTPLKYPVSGVRSLSFKAGLAKSYTSRLSMKLLIMITWHSSRKPSRLAGLLSQKWNCIIIADYVNPFIVKKVKKKINLKYQHFKLPMLFAVKNYYSIDIYKSEDLCFTFPQISSICLVCILALQSLAFALITSSLRLSFSSAKRSIWCLWLSLFPF